MRSFSPALTWTRGHPCFSCALHFTVSRALCLEGYDLALCTAMQWLKGAGRGTGMGVGAYGLSSLGVVALMSLPAPRRSLLFWALPFAIGWLCAFDPTWDPV